MSSQTNNQLVSNLNFLFRSYWIANFYCSDRGKIRYNNRYLATLFVQQLYPSINWATYFVAAIGTNADEMLALQAAKLLVRGFILIYNGLLTFGEVVGTTVDEILAYQATKLLVRGFILIYTELLTFVAVIRTNVEEMVTH